MKPEIYIENNEYLVLFDEHTKRFEWLTCKDVKSKETFKYASDCIEDVCKYLESVKP